MIKVITWAAGAVFLGLFWVVVVFAGGVAIGTLCRLASEGFWFGYRPVSG